MNIRPLTDDDVRFLWDMLLAAIGWADDGSVTADDIRAHPKLSRIVGDWGRDGDRGLVLESADGHPMGAAWYRWWTEDRHVYGYVAADIPESGIALEHEARGHGHGERLLHAILGLARSEGILRVSLAVEQANVRALGLYTKAGFRIVRSGNVDHVMVIDL